MLEGKNGFALFEDFKARLSSSEIATFYTDKSRSAKADINADASVSFTAAKIAVAVESGLLGYEMYQNGQQFYDGDGLVLKGVENTIRNYGYLGRVAMHETNTEIIHMMIQPR